ncbi:hypothetical protein [Streptomyces sp. NPDC026673]|uniref:hypothetical protein n=1 Tax=Streptomyces sp. NPDC026673 TaxID=3155724 RepID=UPI00340C60FD
MAVEALKRAWWALDGALGGSRTPPRLQMRAVRHPFLFGVVFGALFAGLAWLALGRLDPSLAFIGLVMGAVGVLAVLAERERMRHYGHLPKTGPRRPPPPRGPEG